MGHKCPGQEVTLRLMVAGQGELKGCGLVSPGQRQQLWAGEQGSSRITTGWAPTHQQPAHGPASPAECSPHVWCQWALGEGGRSGEEAGV